MAFEIKWLQLATANGLFSPVAVGASPTATALARTSVEIDGALDPGMELLATFLPASPVPGGVRRVAGTQLVTTEVAIAFNRDLPFYWMASVLRKGDIAPNQLGHAYSGAADAFEMPFGDQLTLAHDESGWRIPHFDDGQYVVNVGFGLGRQIAAWGYSVACRPGQPVAMEAGAYQLASSDGSARIGDPVPDCATSWAMPLGSAYRLSFDQRGQGTLSRA